MLQTHLPEERPELPFPKASGAAPWGTGTHWAPSTPAAGPSAALGTRGPLGPNAPRSRPQHRRCRLDPSEPPLPSSSA